MGYHIFTYRKTMLQREINVSEKDMMYKWQEQKDLKARSNQLYERYANLASANDNGALTEAQRLSFSFDLTALSNQEDAIEKEIQLLETTISEDTNELSKVEQQEGEFIKNAIPGYKGTGQNQ